MPCGTASVLMMASSHAERELHARCSESSERLSARPRDRGAASLASVGRPRRDAEELEK
jgi:hypothetical protein